MRNATRVVLVVVLELVGVVLGGNTTTAPAPPSPIAETVPSEEESGGAWVVAVGAIGGLLVLLGVCSAVVWRKLGDANEKGMQEIEKTKKKARERATRDHPLLAMPSEEENPLDGMSDAGSVVSMAMPITPRTPRTPRSPALGPPRTPLTPGNPRRRHRFNSQISNPPNIPMSNSEERLRRAVELVDKEGGDVDTPSVYNVMAPGSIAGKYSLVDDVKKNEMPIWAAKKINMYLVANRAGRWRFLHMDGAKEKETEFTSVQKHQKKTMPHEIDAWRNGDGMDDRSVLIRPVTISDAIEENPQIRKRPPRKSLVQSSLKVSLDRSGPSTPTPGVTPTLEAPTSFENTSFSSKDRETNGSHHRGIIRSPLLPSPHTATRSSTPVVSF